MTAQRLPNPGSDNNTWGDILNGYLSVELDSTGNLKARSDGTMAPLVSGKVPLTNLGGGTASNSNFLRGDGVWAVPGGSGAVDSVNGYTGAVTLAKTDVGLGSVDNTSDTTKNAATVTLTNKTISGASNTLSNIPESAVTNLTTDLAGKAATTHTHTASQISDSTATGRSVLTAADATAARTAIGAGTSNLVIGTSSSTAKAGDYIPTKADVGLGNVDNTSDATQNAATATLTNKTISGASNTLSNIPESAVTSLTSDLAAKAPIASPTFTGKVTTPALQVTTGAGTANQVLTSDVSGNATWAAPASAPVTSVNSYTGAVSLVKADVGLGNVDNTSDATKNAATATLTNKTISGASNTLSSIPESAITNLTTDLTATEKTANKGIANGYAGLNGSSQLAIANIPTGTSSTTVAIGNDTRITGAVQGAATPGGDLSGTYTTPTVSKVNGVSVTGTPTSGQVITASSGTAAAWVSPKNVYTGEVMYPLNAGGELNMSRMIVNQNDIILTSGVIMFGPANIAQVTETITSISTLVGDTTSAGTTFAGYGVYTADATGNLTRVALTTNNTNLWKSQYQPLFGFDVKQSLTASLSKVAGTTYVVGALFVGATAPAIGGLTPNTGDAATSFLAPFRCAKSAPGQTGFPTSISYATLVSSSYAPFFALLP
jgi:hypothetical protein